MAEFEHIWIIIIDEYVVDSDTYGRKPYNIVLIILKHAKNFEHNLSMSIKSSFDFNTYKNSSIFHSRNSISAKPHFYDKSHKMDIFIHPLPPQFYV